MPILQITPSREEEQTRHFEEVARANEGNSLFAEEAFTPVVLMELRDELSRSRLREAAWISIIAHLVAVLLLGLSPKLIPSWAHPNRVVAEDRLRDRETTFLALPPDAQKLLRKPHTNVLSDKDRIATSRNPDQKLMQKMLDNVAPGPPAKPSQRSAPTPPQPQQMAQQAHPQQQAPQQSPSTQQGPQVAMNNPPQFQTPNLQPKITLPKAEPSFNSAAMSAGWAIQQAARASVGSAGKIALGGGMGLGRGPSGGQVKDAMEITTDTQGVDFGPYLARIKQTIETNWYTAMPESVYPPLRKSGKVSIEFVILPDGKVAGMKVFYPSGDVALDRAAWGGISASNPFPPLPKEFHGPYLGLRCYFLYNPTSRDLQ